MKYDVKPLLLLLVFLRIACQSTAAWAESPMLDSPVGTERASMVPDGIPLRITAVHDASFQHIQILQTLAQTLANESQGRLQVELLVGGAAGAEALALKKQIHQKVEGGLTSATTLANSLPAFRLLTLPLLFTAPDQVQSFIDSPLERAMRQTAGEKQLKVLGYGSFGFYGLLAFGDEEPSSSRWAERRAERFLRGSSDEEYNSAYGDTPTYEGLPTRVPKDQWMAKLHQALAIKQMTVPIADLPEAIESGWVKGVVSTPESLSMTPYTTAATRFFDLRHLHGWTVFTVNQDWFDALPADLQQILERVVNHLCREMLDAALERDQAIRLRWTANQRPRMVSVNAVELEAVFRPLVSRTARQLERLLNMPGIIRQLWERNRQPAARSWAPSPEPMVPPPQPESWQTEERKNRGWPQNDPGTQSSEQEENDPLAVPPNVETDELNQEPWNQGGHRRNDHE